MPRLDGVRVLIVDDDAAAREMVTMALEHCGASSRQRRQRPRRGVRWLGARAMSCLSTLRCLARMDTRLFANAHGRPATTRCGVDGSGPRDGSRSRSGGRFRCTSPETSRAARVGESGCRTCEHTSLRELSGTAGQTFYFLVSTAARNRSSDSTSAGSATVSAISWRKSSRYLLRSL